VWMGTGSSAINTRMYIGVTTLGAMLGPSVCSALPANTPSLDVTVQQLLWEREKWDHLKWCKSLQISQQHLETLVRAERSSRQSFPKWSDLCSLYMASRQCQTLDNGTRHLLEAIPFTNWREVILPCGIRARQNLSRRSKEPTTLHQCKEMQTLPTRWSSVPRILLDGKYKLKWFDGDQIPAAICRHIDDEFGLWLWLRKWESDDDSVYSSDESDLDSD